MPAKRTELRQRFDNALTAYLKAIETSKEALLAAIRSAPGAQRVYLRAWRAEKKARREYRKATRRLRELFPRR